MTIAEEVVLVIITEAVCPSVSKIMAIAEGTIRKAYSQTSTDGTLPLPCCLLHPVESSVVCFVVSYAMRFCGKSCAPHLWQDIKVGSRLTIHQQGGLTDILLGLSPTDVGL